MKLNRPTVVAIAATALTATAVIVPVTAANAAPIHACGNHSLTISVGPEDGATGHSDFPIRFKNKTHKSCSLRGYPGLDALNYYGHVLTHARRTVSGFTGGSHHGIQTIVVRPGRYASADVEWLNFNPRTSGDCLYSHSIAVTAANTSTAAYFPRRVSVCELQIHPTVAGITGSH